jgi:hypothetical protein
MEKWAMMDVIRRASTSARQKRFALFQDLVAQKLRSSQKTLLRVLDVGGLEEYWRQVKLTEHDNLDITLLNLTEVPCTMKNMKSVVGDGCDMPCFNDGEFDIVFSNSCIEHVGGFTEQMRMAKEIQRVGQAYYVQTPNYCFPIEPHSFVPFLQFFPRWAKPFLVRHFTPKERLMVDGFQEEILDIRMLTRRHLMELFPDGHIWEERVFGLAKSFVVYDGWE